MDWSIVIDVVGVVLFALGIATLPSGMFLQLSVSRAEENCTLPMQVKVVGQEKRHITTIDRTPVIYWFPIVEFEWNGTTYQVPAGLGTNQKKCPKAGDTIKVLVNPNDPTEVDAPSTGGRNALPLLIIGAISLPLGILMSIPLIMFIFS